MIVRLSTISHAPGDRVAGVLFRGRSTQALRDTRAVGGFGVATGPEPLTVTRPIKGKTALRAGDAFPFVDDVPVRLSQGWYTLLLWRGPTLGPYSRWFPAAEPGLAVRQVPVHVVAGSPTTIEVTAMPRRPRELALDALPRCGGR